MSSLTIDKTERYKGVTRYTDPLRVISPVMTESRLTLVKGFPEFFNHALIPVLLEWMKITGRPEYLKSKLRPSLHLGESRN